MTVFYLVNCLALVVVYTSGSGHPFAAVLLAASFLVSLACFTHAVFARSLSAASFTYLLYATYGLILAGLMQVRADRFFWIDNSVRRELIPDAAVIVFVTTVAFAAGYFLRLAGRPPPLEAVPPVTDPDRRMAMSRATFAVCALAALYLVVNLLKYGPMAFIGTRYTTNLVRFASGDLVTGGLVFTLTSGMAIGAIVISGYVLFRLRLRNRWTMSAFALSCVTIAIANFPPALARFWLIATILAILMSVATRWLRRRKTLLFASAPLLMFFLFPLLQAYNRWGETLNFDFSFDSPLETMLHGDYDGVQSVVNVLGLIEQEGLSYGGRLLSALLFFVPRAIWSGKYPPTGMEAAASAGFSFTNISAPLPAEFYADFHVVGAVLAMALLGWLIRALDDRYEQASRPFPTMMAVIIAGFAPILGRGSLLGVIAAPASALFLLIVWWLLLRVRLSGRGPVHPGQWPRSRPDRS